MNVTASSPRLWALIACGGHGSRFGSTQPKQYTPLLGQPLVMHTLQAFAAVARLSKVVVAVAPEDDVLDALRGANIQVAHCGGATRAQTVLNGLDYLQNDLSAAADDWVLVHDAARCLITPAEIERLIDACYEDAVGGLLALPLADTLKHAQDGRAQATVSRQDLWLAQTPQMFRLGVLRLALQQQGDQVTDEASAIEAQGLQPKLIASQIHNLKVTYPQDLELAQALMQKNAPPNWRIGEGWDTHALVEGRPLMLGGVHVPYHLGLLGHSDADVLLHAITDALLGAASLGDIGSHFSDTDAQYKNADSWKLLQRTGELLSQAGWLIGHIDSTIIAQAPKLAPHISAMRTRIAQALSLDVSQVNVKAKTAEKMGPVGLGQSMEARAVAMVYRA